MYFYVKIYISKIKRATIWLKGSNHLDANTDDKAARAHSHYEGEAPVGGIEKCAGVQGLIGCWNHGRRLLQT